MVIDGLEEVIMPLLKDDRIRREKVRTILSRIISNLDYIDSEKAEYMASWLEEKSIYYKKHYLKNGIDAPKDISTGDIIRVRFGYNIGDELSEEGQDCHFAIVWARKGFTLIVIPLTKEPKDKDFAINLGIIEGLPEKSDSWAKMDAVCSISIRRVKPIGQVPTGKISIIDNTTMIKQINDKVMEVFIKEIQETVD